MKYEVRKGCSWKEHSFQIGQVVESTEVEAKLSREAIAHLLRAEAFVPVETFEPAPSEG